MTADRLNLKDVRALVVDGDQFGATLTIQMLHGLGLDTVHLATSGAAAQEQLAESDYELCICESDLPDMHAASLLRWIRRLSTSQRFLPVLVMTGYSELRNVAALRDAGAHLVVRKPASPKILYDRITWVSRPVRDFVETPSYVGPDRRFRNIGPPGGVPRRATDLSIEVGEAAGPNMSQDEIDSLIRPMKILAG